MSSTAVRVRKRRSGLQIGCVTAGLVLVLLGAPVARADDQSFLQAVQVVGFPQGPDVLLRTARSACYGLIRSDPQEVASRVRRFTGVTPDQANQFLALAITEYCPQYGS